MTGSNASLEQFEEVVQEMTAFDKELHLRKKAFFSGKVYCCFLTAFQNIKSISYLYILNILI